MSKQELIEEMTKITCQMYRREEAKKCAGVQNCDCKCLQYNRCEALYNLGYRKASEVAREIFEEIEENLNNLIRYYKEKRKYVTEIEYSEFEQRYCDIKIRTFEDRLLKIAELKKKYTGTTEGEG